MTSFADVETSSDAYADRFRGAVGSWFLKVQESICLKLLAKNTQTRSVLDVGGGHGQLAFPFASHSYAVTVAGSTPECEHRVKQLTKNGIVQFIAGDLLPLPFPDKSFDSVSCIRLLTHCDRWKELVAELCRVSRFQVIVDYPPSRSFNILYRFLFALKKGAEGDTRTFTIFEDSEVTSVFETCGFKLEQRCPQFFLPMVLYRKAKSAKFGKIVESVFKQIGLTQLFGSPTIASFVRSKGDS